MKTIYREDLLDKSDSSIYRLIIVATKRALEVAEGAPRLIEAEVNVKPTTIALLEILEGKVKMKKGKS
ncbi:MAG: DNA-directed RNA polymerase subunit omega [Omnitrophica WOR_2 bacterium GWF2_43_52]|nr:MAG: DNA-directed RNA polymerase subunit omega [Omnitrophica WOR_2 bacterium GWA2_44_7]OGX18052.1 MAG: DNA-directed RNA polymerase subunit omega [Omnitrophica WOR_2 bacterium GWC2_44_8]OGX20502.1 MAG: DNA-directed RNA polymerase subunit omega [Omnitrophica WOR_2 bacterium GWF2_43_52]OGX56095.1 MAG: DNA-directed RNA polymerase subunit omega [Omnitrophica WOR_2 bacterium RIFOXYC2_FULL_43_9]HAH20557.1 DNA-directed RNA polymerase subunit omega [Candidatus Omnitrophota bacterium]